MIQSLIRHYNNTEEVVNRSYYFNDELTGLDMGDGMELHPIGTIIATDQDIPDMLSYSATENNST